ncbi:snaclec rhodocetin subunit alpha-like [Mizuhopecten yessoensis]|uniref:Galactose-specific lectin nattectin n=2 Tax=Mizuhopecten yessoensis TaxID=6573 RepID=A0A210R6W9_MIZYE|nr:snaclec rhodocetin subunit alpha-like [Mizuhopecten yessoensis]OWF56793.1 Galactose-specific lectin nattectin [Mizuhopecten yessoensis]
MRTVLKITLVLANVGLCLGTGMTKEGCELGWTHHKRFCYQFNVHPVEFITAREICSTKDAQLVSIWNFAEEEFVLDKLWQGTDKAHLSWLGFTFDPEGKKQRYSWIDGSLSDYLDKDMPDTDLPLCGTIKGTGERQFWDCEERMSAFICKKSLQMAYVVSEVFNTSYVNMYRSEDPERMLFERVWPPKLEEVPKHLTRIATAQVSQETDCANRCFHVDDCRGFMLTCLSAWKCNQFSCDLYQPANN